MPKYKRVPMKQYEAKRTYDTFLMLSSSLLKSEIFKSLSKSAMIVYIYMRFCAQRRSKVDYALSYAIQQSPIKSKATVDYAIDELISKGFIIVIRASTGGGHAPRTFQFSNKWIELDKALYGE